MGSRFGASRYTLRPHKQGLGLRAWGLGHRSTSLGLRPLGYDPTRRPHKSLYELRPYESPFGLPTSLFELGTLPFGLGAWDFALRAWGFALWATTPQDYPTSRFTGFRLRSSSYDGTSRPHKTTPQNDGTSRPHKQGSRLVGQNVCV